MSDVYPAYREMCDLICTTQEAVVEKSDVIFAALPHGLSQELAAECDKKGKAFIDLGADFRLKSEEEYTEWYGGTFTDKALHEKAVYGLPELFREEIKKTKLVANPGCYTTAVPLALVPALEKGYIETTGIIANCASGVTGAGRKPAQNSHYPELNEGMSAYKVACHRHTPEIEQTLSKISGEKMHITFVPHLLPVNRGILATCYAKLKPGVRRKCFARRMRKDTAKSRLCVCCQRARAPIFTTSSTRISAMCPFLRTCAPARSSPSALSITW